MFSKKVTADFIARSSENENDRRNFMRAAGLAGAGIVGSAAMVGAGPAAKASADDANNPSDSAVLNFALNLEYLEAEFYSYAAFGRGLGSSDVDGSGTIGRVTGGAKVPFATKAVRQYAEEIAADEVAHVKFLRSALGGAKVARPNINLRESFTAAARAAGLIGAGQTFNPFADENSFLLGAFIFEDVGVTAYKGAAPLISNKVFLEAAAGILAVEAYHAGIIRTVLLSRGLQAQAKAISDARDSLDGKTDLDQGITTSTGVANLVPTDANAIAYSRTPGQVLNIVYLTNKQSSEGGFFPNSVNGTIRISQNNA